METGEIGKDRLERRVAVVTGASRGIGRSTALTFAKDGAKVVVNYRTSEREAEKVVRRIKEIGGDAFAFKADVGVREQVDEMVEKALAEFGGVDILVNNAGVSVRSASRSRLSEEEFYGMWRTNVNGIDNCTQSVAPKMKEKRYGKIVNIASVAGIGTSVLPGNRYYAMTKGAAIILTKRYALELGMYNINVNAIAPGLIRTDMGLGGRTGAELEERLRYYREHSMLRRVGEPNDIANVALFLASDESSFITGQVITVDGGRTDFITHSV